MMTKKKILNSIFSRVVVMERRTKARKVEIPPLRNGGPIWIKVSLILSSLEPFFTLKPWAM